MKNNWSISQIPNLTGKIIIVTEGDSSLGYETIKAFAKNGAQTIIACRESMMGEKIKAEVEKLYAEAKIVVMPLDLRDPKSIQSFGKDFNSTYERLDVLMNIGDSHTIPAGENAKFFGKNYGNDHAGHFVLTSLLLNKLAATPHSRVVNISLGEYKLKEKDFNKLVSPNGHSNAEKHKIGSSKWTNQLFTYELQKLFDTNKVSCAAVSAFTGPGNRNLERRLRNELSWRLFKPFFSMFSGPDSLESAMPALKAAMAGNVKGGEYFGPNGVVDSSGYQSYNAVLHFVA
jgi:NAD(P)-dependent dehydrogenase (short-subunit alcohol dehydrogenase family)